jgi:hypothetical protein
MKKLRSGIYVIENKETKQQYCGMGLSVEKRMMQAHKECGVLYSAIDEYGREKFDRRVVIYCEEWELSRLEIACIKIFHSHVSEGGYNTSWGGTAPMMGRKHTQETKVEMSESRSGKKAALWGKHHSEETRKKIGNANRNPSAEKREKLRNAQLGRVRSVESRKKQSDSVTGEKNHFWGKHHTEESKNLISVNHADVSGKNNYWYGKTGKNNPRYGSHLPDKTKKLISKALLGRKTKNASSKYFGISKVISKKKYIYFSANITINGKQVYIKKGKNELEIALLYDKYIIEHDLPHPLNFPELDPRKNKLSS